MQRLFNSYSGQPAVTQKKRLPPPGHYYAKVLDARYLQFVEQDSCYLIEYLLVDQRSFAIYNFSEMISTRVGNPRSDAYFHYLRMHSLSVDNDNSVVGITETLEVIDDFVGGYRHPITIHHELISRPGEEIDCECYIPASENEDDLEDDDVYEVYAALR